MHRQPGLSASTEAKVPRPRFGDSHWVEPEEIRRDPGTGALSVQHLGSV